MLTQKQIARESRKLKAFIRSQQDIKNPEQLKKLRCFFLDAQDSMMQLRYYFLLISLCCPSLA